MPRTLDAVEVVWILFASVGLVTSMVNLWFAWGQLKALERSGINGTLLILRGGAVDDQAKLLGCFVCMVGIGVAAAIHEPSRDANPVAGMFLLAIGIIMLWFSISVRLRQLAYERRILLTTSDPLKYE